MDGSAAELSLIGYFLKLHDFSISTIASAATVIVSLSYKSRTLSSY